MLEVTVQVARGQGHRLHHVNSGWAYCSGSQCLDELSEWSTPAGVRNMTATDRCLNTRHEQRKARNWISLPIRDMVVCDEACSAPPPVDLGPALCETRCAHDRADHVAGVCLRRTPDINQG
jgi:hypothetical protein